MRVVNTAYPPDVADIDTPLVDDPRLSMLERQLHDAILELAKRFRWDVYHTADSRRSKAGFPDLVLWRKRVIFAELKSTNGKLREDQVETLNALANAGANVFVWRPVDWVTGAIEHELRRI